MKFQFRFAWNARSSPAFGQRTSIDQLAQLSVAPMTGFFKLTRSYSATCTRSSQLQRWDAAKRRFSFVFKIRYRYRTCLEKDTKECSCPICDSSCCRTSCVSVRPCTPKVCQIRKRFYILRHTRTHTRSNATVVTGSSFPLAEFPFPLFSVPLVNIIDCVLF